MTILKVQRPVATTDSDSPWLFYDERRSIMFELPEKDVPRNIKQIMGSDFKVFTNLPNGNKRLLTEAKLAAWQYW